MRTTITSAAILFGLLLVTGIACGDNRVGDVCRVKGQEENTLQGVGIVAGLRGTGDGDSKPTQRALAQMLELMGSRVGPAKDGGPNLDELKNAKNVALVFVTATIPGSGASPGDQVDCIVSAMSAKSLEGGYLMISALKGPNRSDPVVYATAQGMITIEDGLMPQTGRINRGATIERELKNDFIKNNKITLLLKPEFASFEFSSLVAQAINENRDLKIEDKESKKRSSDYFVHKGFAKASGADRVEIEIPPHYADEPEYLVDVILSTRLQEFSSRNTVIINKRQKAVIVGADVEIAPVAVMHKNRVIEAGGPVVANSFVPVEVATNEADKNAKLQSLVNALNALQVPAEDVIEIILMLKQKRALSGQLIIQ